MRRPPLCTRNTTAPNGATTTTGLKAYVNPLRRFMAEEGHAPTTGLGNRLFLLGKGICPDCRGELRPGGNNNLACPKCDTAYSVGDVP